MRLVTRSKNCARHWSALTIVAIMLTALCCMGCTSSRSQSREMAAGQGSTEQEASTTITRKQVRLTPIPAAVASLRLAAVSLPDLPDGLPLSMHNGRATVTVERDGDSLIVTATCDSLERQIEIVEEELWRTKQQAEAYRSQLEESAKQRSNGVWPTLKWLFAGIAAGVVLTIITTKIYGSIRRR